WWSAHPGARVRGRGFAPVPAPTRCRDPRACDRLPPGDPSRRRSQRYPLSASIRPLRSSIVSRMDAASITATSDDGKAAILSTRPTEEATACRHAPLAGARDKPPGLASRGKSPQPGRGETLVFILENDHEAVVRPAPGRLLRRAEIAAQPPGEPLDLGRAPDQPGGLFNPGWRRQFAIAPQPQGIRLAALLLATGHIDGMLKPEHLQLVEKRTQPARIRPVGE